MRSQCFTAASKTETQVTRIQILQTILLILFRAAVPRRRCTGSWFYRDAGLPNGQLPILEVQGKVLPQSGAQLRYVGKLAGTHARYFSKTLCSILAFPPC